MTWGEFKKAMEEAGVKDEDGIWYIDIQDPITIITKESSLGWRVE